MKKLKAMNDLFLDPTAYAWLKAKELDKAHKQKLFFVLFGENTRYLKENKGTDQIIKSNSIKLKIPGSIKKIHL